MGDTTLKKLLEEDETEEALKKAEGESDSCFVQHDEPPVSSSFV